MPKIKVSSGKGGKVKVVHEENGALTVVLFESVGKDTLESRFDPDGSLANQRLLMGSNPVSAADQFIEAIGPSERIVEEYVQIKLDKSCPHCAAKPLTRYMDTIMFPTEVPVMPLYVCGSCKRRSYYLTDSYLKNLVATNKQLFEPAELDQLDKNEKAFMAELRAYIIRIFASKSIPYIK